MKKCVGIILTVITLLSCGCQKSSEGGTTTGNPLVNFKIAGSSATASVASYRPLFMSPWWREILKPAMALPPPSLVDSNGTTVLLSDAWIVVKDIEFKASESVEEGEVSGDSISLSGPYVVNILDSVPELLGSVRIPTTTLRRIRMKLHNADSLPNSAPPALINKSIYWKGSVGGHAFSISSEEGYEYELAGPTGVNLSDGADVLLSIRIADLFKKMNLSGITTTIDISESNRLPSVNPCPLIDPSAQDIYTCFNRGLKSESDLGRDIDGDDELGDGDDLVK